MKVDKLAVWVHPLWSTRDLGGDVVRSWTEAIDSFSQDADFAFVLTGCPTDYCPSKEWGNRILPVIESLEGLFGDRYFRWPDSFIKGDCSKHIDMLQSRYDLPEVGFSDTGYPLRPLFREAGIDGLQPEICVMAQRRRIRSICDPLQTYSWGESLKAYK